MTVDDVARRAGVGKGTVYLHWASKLERSTPATPSCSAR
ncbi:helix-turn-helix domain-containing protein [Pseudonocardia sp. H11422]